MALSDKINEGYVLLAQAQGGGGGGEGGGGEGNDQLLNIADNITGLVSQIVGSLLVLAAVIIGAVITFKGFSGGGIRAAGGMLGALFLGLLVIGGAAVLVPAVTSAGGGLGG